MSDSESNDYRDLFENAPCGYLTIGPDGRITKVNATLTTWTGFGADRFVGQRLHQFLNMAGRIYYETHIATLLRMQGFFNEFALDFETAAGERLPVIANAAERRDAGGAVLFTALIVIKAADRRRYERQLVDSRSELQKGLANERETAELREQFIAVLGHDLRNPLAAISAGARILQRSGALQQQKELRILDMINSTVTRMSDLIDNILDFARGRLGSGIALHRDAQPLGPVLDQVVDELRTASPHRVIETSFDIVEPVNCDHTRIGQLASNLTANALIHGAPDRPVRVGARTDDREFTLWVANAGEQIPEQAMQRLFEPFFRGEVRNSRNGLGLGLHIASQIAQAHGGRIDVTSTPEETRFVFSMPLVQTGPS
ncbi:sigma-B regulation protein RsbU (phosphoserine phosphatase) [Bradyrhizobium ottawaense]|uniref:PAS domain-containing sensor histidine kinase n=1 Tax=Bradyrhizobium ottawaense TaxID=931866 RepID=UPI001BA60E0E|nr:PAS domain-containing sensor histidine kinase [Bradyrhizobium diazoefficiens]MBR0925175.1 PAS domain-containing sensor histidine kinase [Bradyrhizobium diazoefficiens]